MIIAVDFDGILCENVFPDIGRPNYEIIMRIRQLIDQGQEVILWTSRVDKELQRAIEWCNDYGLHFCAVNENAPSNIEQYKTRYPNGTRKVYADFYIDDHNIEYRLYNTQYKSGCTSQERLCQFLDTLIKRGSRNE